MPAEPRMPVETLADLLAGRTRTQFRLRFSTLDASADGGQQLQHLVADVLRQPRVERILLLLDEVQELAKSVNGAQATRLRDRFGR